MKSINHRIYNDVEVEVRQFIHNEANIYISDLLMRIQPFSTADKVVPLIIREIRDVKEHK